MAEVHTPFGLGPVCVKVRNYPRPTSLLSLGLGFFRIMELPRFISPLAKALASSGTEYLFFLMVVVDLLFHVESYF